MPFNQELPEWNASGTKPPQSKLDSGWQIGERPPSGWWNWALNRTYLAIQELQNEAINADQKGVANGVATLGSDSKLTASQLPAIGSAQITDGSITNNDLATDVKVGSLAALTTTTKSNVVAAVNEVKSSADTHSADSVRHVTQMERIKWNGAYDLIGEHTADGSTHLGSKEKIAVTELQNVSDSSWTTATLLNGWTTKFDRALRFRKVGNMLHISGSVGGGTTGDGTSVFVLPVGFRPSRTIVVPVIAAGTGAVLNNNALINRMVVTTGGNVTFSYGWVPEGWAIDVMIPL